MVVAITGISLGFCKETDEGRGQRAEGRGADPACPVPLPSSIDWIGMLRLGEIQCTMLGQHDKAEDNSEVVYYSYRSNQARFH
jgi:hypothetical protein